MSVCQFSKLRSAVSEDGINGAWERSAAVSNLPQKAELFPFHKPPSFGRS